MKFKIVGIKFLLIICLSVCMRESENGTATNYHCLVFVALGAGAVDERVNSRSRDHAQRRAIAVTTFMSPFDAILHILKNPLRNFPRLMAWKEKFISRCRV